MPVARVCWDVGHRLAQSGTRGCPSATLLQPPPHPEQFSFLPVTLLPRGRLEEPAVPSPGPPVGIRTPLLPGSWPSRTGIQSLRCPDPPGSLVRGFVVLKHKMSHFEGNLYISDLCFSWDHTLICQHSLHSEMPRPHESS